jgi:hypothetical protein
MFAVPIAAYIVTASPDTPRLFGTPAARRGRTPDVGEDTATILGRSGKAPD